MRILVSLLILVVLISCKDNKEDFYTLKNDSTVNNRTNIGKSLMETQCYTCHSPNASHDNRIAPPMMAVKKHYLHSETTKEQFVNDIWEWTQNPNEQDAKMKGAVIKFGIMPKQVFSKEDIELIAIYMYEYTLEHPGKGKHHRSEHENGL